MTLTLGKNTVSYVNLAVQVLSAANVPVAADANDVEAAFYRVDASSGALALDILVGTGGFIPLTPVSGVMGMYSCPVPVASLGHLQYQVHIVWEVSGSSRAQVQTLMFLPELDVISDNDPVPASSTLLASKA